VPTPTLTPVTSLKPSWSSQLRHFFKPSTPARPLASYPILLVDDDAAVLASMAAVLSHLGYPVKPALSGDAALQLWQADHGQFSLVLTDVMMPGLDGITFARSLRQQNANLPIVLLSGYLDEDTRWIVNAEGFRLSDKPSSIEQMRAIVSSVLGEPATATHL
jgi:CheY-like chemotaxis protein